MRVRPPSAANAPEPRAERIRRWVRPEVLAAAGYPLPEVPEEAVRLDAMENPYPLPDGMREEWAASFRDLPINRYPDGGARRLLELLRDYWELPADVGMLPGNGSDEHILNVSLALARPERVVLAPEPTFFLYRHVTETAGMKFIGVPLREGDFALDVDAFLQAIERHQPSIVWLANPNNPTGKLYDPDEVRRIIESAPGVVVVDEAYQPYSRHTLAGELPRHGHLLLLRTLSKIGMAGLRMGALIGARDWIEQIDKVRLPYNVSILNQHAVAFLIERREFIERQLESIRASRDDLYRKMQRLTGIRVWPSETNFLLFRTRRVPANRMYKALLHHTVLVRQLDGSHPSLAGCLRVSVGTPEENRFFLQALEETLAA